MSIDLGNNPIGTPPTLEEQAQMRDALGINVPNFPLALTTPLPTFSRYGSSFFSFKRGDVANGGKADVGQLGTAEANLSWNMDYTGGYPNHHYWDSTLAATWIALSGTATRAGFAVQYAPAGLSGGNGDIWDLAGNPYIFSSYGNASGGSVFIGGAATPNDAYGPTMPEWCRLVIMRGTSECDIAGGSGGIKIEGTPPGGWGIAGGAVISLNTISNAAVTTGTGTFTAGGNATVVGSLSSASLTTSGNINTTAGDYQKSGVSIFPISVSNGGTGSAVQPLVIAYSNTALVVDPNTVTIVPLNTETADADNAFDNALYRFKPTVSGYYRLSASVLFSGVQSGKFIFASFYKNGSEAHRFAHFVQGSNIGELGGSGGTIIHMNGTTDYVDIRTYCNNVTTGATLYGAAQYTNFQAEFIKK